MKNVIYCTAIVSFILFANSCSCTKENAGPAQVLPPITQTGANTFGCKVNGKIWVPFWPCADLVAGAVELGYNIQPINQAQTLPVFFSVSAGSKTEGSVLLIQQNYSLSDHIYGIGNIHDSVLIHFFANGGTNYINYSAQPGDTAARYLQITKLDTVNKIISGIFAFTLYGGSDSLVVTDGRFDLKIGQFERCTQ